MPNVSNMQDVIDSRDIIERIEELEADRDALVDAYTDAKDHYDETIVAGRENNDESKVDELTEAQDKAYDAYKEAETALEEWDASYDGEELETLKTLAEEASQYSSDWSYGEQLIRDSYFTEYVEELCDDLGYIPNDFPAWITIDWEDTADNVKQDYTSVDFDGVEYWIRAS
jgi:hypothetical protein